MTAGRWLSLLAGLVVVAAVVAIVQCERIEDGIYQAGLAAERQRAGLEIGYIETGSERMAYLERSGEGERVVLIHGFASQKDIWLQLSHYLPEAFHVLVPDLPGHGESSREPDRDYTVPALAGAVARFIEMKAAGEPVHLAGSSLGGAVSLLVAAERPDLVDSLILFNPAGAPGAVASELRETGADFDNPLIVTDRQDFDRLVELVFHDPPVIPWPSARVLTRMHAERAELHRRIWADVRATDRPVAGILQSISVPVLLVWGEQDQVLDISSVEFFAEHLDELSVRRMEQAGHTPIMEQPGVCAGYLSEFVTRHSRR